MRRSPIRCLVYGALMATVALPQLGAQSARSSKQEGCTVIGVGRLATVDGSVITSHTDCCSECRIQVIPGRTFPKGSMAPVHWGMVYFGAEDDRKTLPLGEFGKVIGEVPQVEHTHAYFHTGYSQMNEKQLAIGESTCSQRAELDVPFVEGITRQIMTIEQAQVFALERCATAREAVRTIGSLVEKYGFLPSCGGSEALCIADPRDLWTMEICSVGTEWTPESGKPGAIWAARRVPDDHAVVIANSFRIRELDLKNPEVLASPNVVREAIDRGWYNPKSGQPFIWQEVYAPPVMEGNLSRIWLVTSRLAPSLKPWPKRSLDDLAGPRTLYAQPLEGAAFYPFSFRPERKVSVRDVISFQRSAFEDTVQQPIVRRGKDEAPEPDLLSATSMLRVDLEELGREVLAADASADPGTEIIDLSGRTGELATVEVSDLDVTGELERMDLNSEGDITMSEVGTKLDLARAYIDMGDPEGARSILEEVLKEGGAGHKLEAERLMAGLP